MARIPGSVTMHEFEGSVAVVTGAASGIGFGLAKRFAREGMKVVLADIEEGALDAAVAAIVDTGGTAVAVRTDVSDAAQVEALADRAVAAFGRINILCNNAGVYRGGNAWELSVDDWTWMLGVNLWGVVHGLRACVPRMLEQGDPCHIVNTASAGGLVASRGGGAYGASKFAVVAISEGVAEALADTQIGVSVLCPGGVSTRIFQSERNRPAALAAVGVVDPVLQKTIAASASPSRTDQASPDWIADIVFEAIRADQFYILPVQPHFKLSIAQRLERLGTAIASSPTTGP
jgi:NAD(P)-dependent dehydrogenase (short-subunit alcohol dehydrogenase family)